jgi:hypothetical protein
MMVAIRRHVSSVRRGALASCRVIQSTWSEVSAFTVPRVVGSAADVLW